MDLGSCGLNNVKKSDLLSLKEEIGASIVAHYYQKDEIYDLADFTGDSYELAMTANRDSNNIIIFCGVEFMGESVKVLNPSKRVFMPKLACCAMAKMIDDKYFDNSLSLVLKSGIKREDLMFISYINSSASIKAKVGILGGSICTSSSALKIIKKAISSKKRVFFMPDRCLAENISRNLGVSFGVIGKDDISNADIISYDGFCSVHQLFEYDDIVFFRNYYPDIKIVSHPECKPEVCANSDFVGSTSQIIKYVRSLPKSQKVAIGTEFNLVNRIRKENTFVLSSSKPECPTMNETTIEDLYHLMLSIKDGYFQNEIILDKDIARWARIALEKMFKE